ncbi:MAG: hypothetical protein ABIP85_05600 [Chthoniobacteraceae bacterium]
MLKGRSKPENGGDAADTTSQPQFKENAQVNAKIDDYIKANPKHWEYIQSMTPDRMARALVLSEVQKLDRQEKMRAGVMKKLDQNPEMKKALETVVKNLPEDQREKVMASLAMRAMRANTQQQQKPAQQAGVKV